MKILLLGESWTVHETHMKGFDIFNVVRHEENCGENFAKLFRNNGAETVFMPSHVAQTDFPDSQEALAQYDLVILSDIGSNTLLLAPDTFYRGERKVNRLQLLVDFVKNGGGLAMIGGYLSFAGIDNKARYAMTPLAEVLPVEMLNYDDRIECPEGIHPSVSMPDHPMLNGIDSNWPYFLGYNKIKAKKSADELAKIGDDCFIAAMECGKGRSVAFASDCAPHWGPKAFMDWSGYALFFQNMAKWLAKEI